ncbi:MAG: NEL-type E3 ubiquitin ligase domain-containing protein [Candidatus Algichlamydia australiensis]|nr:NEL-type E3 ubiquitin ligase domain-containing protein [Chlamydiales bacterium]
MNKVKSAGIEYTNYFRSLSIENKITTVAYLGIGALSLYFLYCRYQNYRQNLIDKAWISQGREGEKRGEAIKRVKRCIRENSRYLDLSNLKLTELPPNLERLTWITDLELKENRLCSIPPEIQQLKRLKTFDLSYNELEGLPDWFYELPLKTLKLSHNSNFDSNRLILPPSLQDLHLSSTGLRTIPINIFNLQFLRTLKLDHNEISEVPPTISILPNLNTLNLSHNSLNSLPLVVGELRSLRHLDIQYNNFDELPQCVNHLHRDCQVFQTQRAPAPVEQPELPQESSSPNIFLDNSNFRGNGAYTRAAQTSSQNNLDPRIHQALNHQHARIAEILQALRESLEASRRVPSQEPQEGPRVTTSLSSNRGFLQTLQSNWDKLNRVAGKQVDLSRLDLNRQQKNALGEWLRKVGDMAQSTYSEESKVEMAVKICEYFELAIEDQNWKEELLSTITSATISCSDSVALMIIDIGIAKRLLDFGIDDSFTLATFIGKTAWVVELLKEFSDGVLVKLRNIQSQFPILYEKLQNLDSNSENYKIELRETLVEAREVFKKISASNRTGLHDMNVDSIVENLVPQYREQKIREVCAALANLINNFQRITIDDIETQLAIILSYPNLEIDITRMSFEACSLVTEKDKEDAKNYVHAELSNPDKYYSRLLANKKWHEALKKKFPGKMNEIEEIDDDTYEQRLIDLSKKFLTILTEETLPHRCSRQFSRPQELPRPIEVPRFTLRPQALSLRTANFSQRRVDLPPRSQHSRLNRFHFLNEVE